MQLSYGRRSISGPGLMNEYLANASPYNYGRAEIVKEINTNNKQVKTRSSRKERKAVPQCLGHCNEAT